MIKIIKVGTRKKIECDECGSLLSYENEDIKKLPFNMKTETTSGYKEYIMCPQCNNEIVLSSTR